jgi:TonB family protein
VNDAVDRVIVERQAMDDGFPGGLALSAAGHVLLLVGALAAPFLFPKGPPLRVLDGFAVALPPGGGGTPHVEPEAPAKGPEAQPKPEPPPKVIKPPKAAAPAPKHALPEPSQKPVRRRRPRKEEPPAQAYDPSQDATPRRAAPAAGASTSSQTPGLEFAPPGPGVPGGTDWLGDWYLAGVQRKIWAIWMQQIHADFRQQAAVRFTIQSDGSVSNVEVVQSSGAALLDLAAQRSIYSAAPFGPLPKSYGTNQVTIQAIFKPND